MRAGGNVKGMPEPPALLANAVRGGRIESQHYGDLVAVDGEGNIVSSRGDSHFVRYMRRLAWTLRNG
jgi:L-asparaginase II